MTVESSPPWGLRWRSSQSFVITTATLSLFSECFLFGFIVPILPHMLEVRLHQDPSRTQSFTTTLLTLYGLISLVSAPVIAHFADQTPSRKTPLLLSLFACASGTILVAAAPTVWALLTGQVLQALASSSVWIVGFATLADNVEGDNKGRVLGTTMAIVGTGVFAGPMVSGILLQLLGYWPAWSAALLLLAVDFVARLVMIDNRSPAETATATATTTTTEPEEQTALLSSEISDSHDTPDKSVPASGFYRIMLGNAQVVASLFNALSTALILSAFDTTLPLHVRDVFSWGSLPVGILFLGLQAPSVVLGAPIGWLRDRIGLRWPTTVGWAMMIPLLWLLAIPGETFFWGRLQHGGEVVYILAIVGLGFAFALIRGSSTLQMMAVVHDLESKNPKIFGPYGGNSRLSSMTEIPINVGMMLGPLLSGTVAEFIGYFYMNTAFAIVALLVAVSSWVYITAAPKQEEAAV
ncbi:major facilitator superfamily domain-containing protein [Aspergillus aurantiobrunneus]